MKCILSKLGYEDNFYVGLWGTGGKEILWQKELTVKDEDLFLKLGLNRSSFIVSFRLAKEIFYVKDLKSDK